MSDPHAIQISSTVLITVGLIWEVCSDTKQPMALFVIWLGWMIS